MKKRNWWYWTWEYLNALGWMKKWSSWRKKVVEDEKKLGKKEKDEEYEVELEDY